MDNIIQLLFSRLSHSKQISSLSKPPPSFSFLITKNHQQNEEILSNYSSISEQIDIEIERRIINVGKIKEIGSQVYKMLSQDISRLNSNHQNLQELPNLKKVLEDCESKHLKIIQQLIQGYNKIKETEKDQDEQAFFNWIKNHFSPYSKVVLKEIIPLYSQILAGIKIKKRSNAQSQYPLLPKFTREEYNSQIGQFRQILNQVRSIISKEYQNLLYISPNTFEQSQKAIDFACKLKQIFSQVLPFLCGSNNTLEKMYSYTQNLSNSLLEKVKSSYSKYIRSGNVCLMKIQSIFNIEHIHNFYHQCNLQVSKYLYMKYFIQADINSIQINSTHCIDLVNSLLVSHSSKSQKKVQQNLDQLQKLLDWSESIVCAGVSVYFREAEQKINASIIKISQLKNGCETLTLFYKYSFQKCLNIFTEIKHINQRYKNAGEDAQKYCMQLYQIKKKLENLAENIAKNSNFLHIILTSINTKIKEIQTLRRILAHNISYSSNFYRNSYQQPKTPTKPHMAIEQNIITPATPKVKHEMNDHNSSAKNNESNCKQKLLPKRIQMQQVVLILEECQIFFQTDLKTYISSGNELAIYQLQNPSNINKKSQSQNKYFKIKNYVQALANKLNFDKNIFKDNPNILRRQTRSLIKIEDSQEQESHSKLSLSLNKSLVQELDIKKQADLALVNVKLLYETLQLDLSTTDKNSIAKLAQECLDFQIQDWVQSISIFQSELKLFEGKIKQILCSTTTNINNLFTSLYKMLKQYSTVLQVTTDILAQSLYIFKTIKKLQKDRKGNLSTKSINFFEAIDVQYLQTINEFKRKMKDEIQQLDNFSNMPRTAKNYLISVYSRFEKNFEQYFPYKEELITGLIQKIQIAGGLKQNHKQIFDTFVAHMESIYKMVQKNKLEQIYEICKEINQLGDEIEDILNLSKVKFPLDESNLEQINRIYRLYQDQFTLADFFCKAYENKNEIKVPNFSSQRRRDLGNKILEKIYILLAEN